MSIKTMNRKRKPYRLTSDDRKKLVYFCKTKRRYSINDCFFAPGVLDGLPITTQEFLKDRALIDEMVPLTHPPEFLIG